MTLGFSTLEIINSEFFIQKINKQIRGFSVSKVQPSQDFKLDP
jgi:hypothetical protein